MIATLESQGAMPPGSKPPGRSYIYRLVLEASLFRGMPSGPDAFLYPPDVFWLRDCAWNHLKNLQSDGQTTNIDFLPAVKPDSSN